MTVDRNAPRSALILVEVRSVSPTLKDNAALDARRKRLIRLSHPKLECAPSSATGRTRWTV
jgi:hypothetical protein